MRVRTALIPALIATGLALTGCSSMETQADEQGVRYEGSVFFPQAPTFKECQAPSLQSFGDPGDGTYIYPAGQRTLKFSTDPGSDAGPLTVSAPSPGGGQPIVLTVSGVVTFTPNFGDCATFQAFHEQIGRKFAAYTPQGWATMIGTYIKDPVDRAADNAALGFDWVALASDAAAKAAWEQAVVDELPKVISELAGGEYFTINSVLLQRPDLPPDVVAAIQRTEAARQEAKTAEQIQAAAATFPGGITAYQQFQQQQAINDAIRSGNVKVLPVPQGSPIIVNPGG